MTIQRIESLVFGVADLELCQTFYTDAGLQLVSCTANSIVLSTREKQTVVLKPMSDLGLPPAMETGPTLRELVWGVDTQASLDRLAEDLVRDRPVSVDAEGVVHSRDNTGFGIAFRLARTVEAPPQAVQPYNMLRQVTRWNDPVQYAEEPRPLRIVHLALNIPKERHVEAIEFYLQRLKFKATDRILDTGTFMQCEGDVEHHNFFLCHRPDFAGFNHFAMEVRNFDEVVAAGNHMVGRKWAESRVMGRHLLGSNLYRFFSSPAGGRLEFVCDMDRLDKNFETRVWEKNPGHHIWSLKTGVEAEA